MQKKETSSPINHRIIRFLRLRLLRYSSRWLTPSIICTETTSSIETLRYFSDNSARKYFTWLLNECKALWFWMGRTWYYKEKIHLLWHLWIYGTWNGQSARIWLQNWYLGLGSIALRTYSLLSALSSLNFWLNESKN